MHKAEKDAHIKETKDDLAAAADAAVRKIEETQVRALPTQPAAQ